MRAGANFCSWASGLTSPTIWAQGMATPPLEADRWQVSPLGCLPWPRPVALPQDRMNGNSRIVVRSWQAVGFVCHSGQTIAASIGMIGRFSDDGAATKFRLLNVSKRVGRLACCIDGALVSAAIKALQAFTIPPHRTLRYSALNLLGRCSPGSRRAVRTSQTPVFRNASKASRAAG